MAGVAQATLAKHGRLGPPWPRPSCAARERHEAPLERAKIHDDKWMRENSMLDDEPVAASAPAPGQGR